MSRDGARAEPDLDSLDERRYAGIVTQGSQRRSELPAAIEAVGPLSNRRAAERVDVSEGVIWAVDCAVDDTFLYASIANISALGIFVRTTEPLPVGTRLTLRFAPPGALIVFGDPTGEPVEARLGAEPFVLEGVVQWVNAVRPLRDNPNPGMGIAFIALSPDERERIVDVIHTIAYLREAPPS